MSVINKPFLDALTGKVQSRPPIWLMRQAGRYLPEYREIRANAGGFLNLCYNPKLACEVTMQPIRRYGFDAAILFSDILVVPDALGQKVEFLEGEGPKLEALQSPSDIAKLSDQWLHSRLEPVYETLSLIKASLPSETALIGFAGAPWTIATYMIEGGSSKDFAKTKLWSFKDPDSFEELLNLIADSTADYLIAQVEAGAEAVQIFDSWASVLPEAYFDRWIIAANKRLIHKFKMKCPNTPVIGFPRGAGLKYIDYIDETGVDAVGLDTTLPLGWARDNLQNKVCVQGNLDPQLLLAGGTAMDEAVDYILETLKDGPFIFNLGHGIIKETPPEHVSRLMDRVRGR